MTHHARCGDSLIEVYRACADHLVEDVVRWCPNCGAIVVDQDCDDRTAPGKTAEMRFPNRERETYGKILSQFSGIRPSDMTAVERKIVVIVSKSAGAIPRLDEHGQLRFE